MSFLRGALDASLFRNRFLEKSEPKTSFLGKSPEKTRFLGKSPEKILFLGKKLVFGSLFSKKRFLKSDF
jgi:hypothetical protein